MVVLFFNTGKIRRKVGLGEELRVWFFYFKFNMYIKKVSGIIRGIWVQQYKVQERS